MPSGGASSTPRRRGLEVGLTALAQVGCIHSADIDQPKAMTSPVAWAGTAWQIRDGPVQGGPMPVQALREYLDYHLVKYVVIQHSPAFTMQEVASATHIPGKELAKTVIVEIDGRLAMAVLQASQRVQLEQLRESSGAQRVALAT